MKAYAGADYDGLDFEIDESEDNGGAVSQGEDSSVETTNKGSDRDEYKIFNFIQRVLILEANSFVEGHLFFSVEEECNEDANVEESEESNANSKVLGTLVEFNELSLGKESTYFKANEDHADDSYVFEMVSRLISFLSLEFLVIGC